MATVRDFEDDVVVLARIAPFALGGAIVRPATREIVSGGTCKIVEPRVMQVLVALAQANGDVVSQQDLIMRCWAGRIVGDNAIHRVISQIRRLAGDFPSDCFALETVTKVGYRLLTRQEDGQAPSPSAASPLRPAERGPGEGNAPVTVGHGANARGDPSGGRQPPPLAKVGHRSAESMSRRTLLSVALVGAALSVGAGGLVWRRRSTSEPDPLAADFARRGMDLVRTGLPGEAQQAIAFLREAVRIDPAYAQGWGQLALAYSNVMPDDPAARYDAKARSAVARALALEPEQPDAKAALILMMPIYGHWAEIDGQYMQALRRHPGHAFLTADYAYFLGGVGRCREAAEQLQGVVDTAPYAPLAYYRLINFLWSAGRLEDAESALDLAERRWPKHPALWETRFKFLTHTGRASSAIALLSDPGRRPSDYADLEMDSWRLPVALAAQSRRPADAAKATQLLARQIAKVPSDLPALIQHVSALGGAAMALEMLRGYYFGFGKWAAAHPQAGTPFSVVGTGMLFHALMEAVRREPGFNSLIRTVGLEEYWSRVGKRPDYRRGL